MSNEREEAMKTEIKIMEKEILYLRGRKHEREKKPTTNFSKNAEAHVDWTNQSTSLEPNKTSIPPLIHFKASLLYTIFQLSKL